MGVQVCNLTEILVFINIFSYLLKLYYRGRWWTFELEENE